MVAVTYAGGDRDVVVCEPYLKVGKYGSTIAAGHPLLPLLFSLPWLIGQTEGSDDDFGCFSCSMNITNVG